MNREKSASSYHSRNETLYEHWKFVSMHVNLVVNSTNFIKWKARMIFWLIILTLIFFLFPFQTWFYFLYTFLNSIWILLLRNHITQKKLNWNWNTLIWIMKTFFLCFNFCVNRRNVCIYANYKKNSIKFFDERRNNRIPTQKKMKLLKVNFPRLINQKQYLRTSKMWR